jgi:CubicO group peptidase (beta-lactamase class C family)
MVGCWLARLTPVFAVLTASFAQIASAQPAPPSQASALASAFDPAAAQKDATAAMERERVPGAQIVAIARDGIVWSTALGQADLERHRPMTSDTLVQVGSVTKVFTATLIADLVAQDRLAWTDTLGKIFPGIAMRPEVARISISDLASHTSRLPKDPPNRVDVDGTWRPYTRQELYAALADPSLKLVKPDWNYSNFGFAILGHVIEKVTGKSYEEVLRERILTPLGMSSTFIALTPQQERLLAVHYWPEDKPLKPRPRWKFGEIAGFGGIASTASDLAKFLAYQMNPRAYPQILNADATVGMRAIRFMFPDWSVGFARPWIEHRQKDGTLIIEHAGEVDGQSAMIMFSPSDQIGVAVTANLGQDGAESVAKAVFPHLLAAARSRTKKES